MNQDKTKTAGRTIWIPDDAADSIRSIRDNWSLPGPRPSFNALAREAIDLGLIGIGDSVRKHQEAMRRDREEQDGLADNRDALKYGSQRGGPTQ